MVFAGLLDGYFTVSRTRLKSTLFMDMFQGPEGASLVKGIVQQKAWFDEGPRL